MRRLETLQRLYPELSLAQLQALADSRERFLVVEPGPSRRWARARGSAGRTRGPDRREPRGAGARRARGGKPLVVGRARRPALHPFDVRSAPARERQGFWQLSADG